MADPLIEDDFNDIPRGTWIVYKPSEWLVTTLSDGRVLVIFRSDLDDWPLQEHLDYHESYSKDGN